MEYPEFSKRFHQVFISKESHLQKALDTVEDNPDAKLFMRTVLAAKSQEGWLDGEGNTLCFFLGFHRALSKDSAYQHIFNELFKDLRELYVSYFCPHKYKNEKELQDNIVQDVPFDLLVSMTRDKDLDRHPLHGAKFLYIYLEDNGLLRDGKNV